MLPAVVDSGQSVTVTETSASLYASTKLSSTSSPTELTVPNEPPAAWKGCVMMRKVSLTFGVNPSTALTVNRPDPIIDFVLFTTTPQDFCLPV